MANPAELLHRQFLLWDSEQTAKISRGLNPPTSDSLMQLRIAVLHLEAIRETVQEMERSGQNVQTWKGAIDRWTRGIFLIPNGPGSPQKSSLAPSDLLLLDAFGQIMQNWVRVIKPEGVTELQEFVADIRSTAKTGVDDHQLARHLDNVLNHVEWCLNNFAQVGEFELDKALTQLAATVTLIDRNESTAERPSRFRRFMDHWVNPFTVGALAGMTGNLASNMLVSSVGVPAIGPGPA